MLSSGPIFIILPMREPRRPKYEHWTLPPKIIDACKEIPDVKIELKPSPTDESWPRNAAYRMRYPVVGDVDSHAFTQYFSKECLPVDIDPKIFLREDLFHESLLEQMILDIHRFPYGVYFEKNVACWSLFVQSYRSIQTRIQHTWSSSGIGAANTLRHEVARRIAKTAYEASVKKS